MHYTLYPDFIWESCICEQNLKKKHFIPHILQRAQYNLHRGVMYEHCQVILQTRCISMSLVVAVSNGTVWCGVGAVSNDHETDLKNNFK